MPYEIVEKRNLIFLMDNVGQLQQRVKTVHAWDPSLHGVDVIIVHVICSIMGTKNMYN